MKLYAPDYYGEFSCIADRCLHSCCVGWEIDIDEDTFEYYGTVTGDFGTRLKNGISTDGGVPHFILSKNESCPFLNNNGLCDIILNLGENSLCGICADHPRYRNFFQSRTEIGLGLCCEAAGRLILTNEKKVTLILLENDAEVGEARSDDEEGFFMLREHLLETAQNREKSVDERMENVFQICDCTLPKKSLGEWCDVYLSLERLNDDWTRRLNDLKKLYGANDWISVDAKWEMAREQLFVYFLLRHTADALYDGQLKERVAFAKVSVQIITALFAAGTKKTMDELIEIARQYSSEIEYCEENIEQLLEIIGNQRFKY
jgi:lysine-N-methylase